MGLLAGLTLENEARQELSLPRVFCELIHATVGRAEPTKFVSYVPPTAVVKLQQHSGLGSNTGMGFHPMNDLHQC